jgi:hypothetical protein|tara:strand:+ start:1760 stop:2371 length:612 start_codon:yes stop_codon:yes gene_type:complete
MSFKKKKYTIIKEAISKELALFLYNYILIKRQVAETMFKHQYISPIELSWGHWTDNQVPNTYSHYADVAMETLLLRLNPLMEKATGLKLYPNYSYCRVYKKGDILKRHIDRFSCEISTTMNLGGNEWPIFLLINKKEVKVNLKPGDMLIYRGEELEHWREPFKGKDCAQVFFHYNNKKTKDAKLNMFDKKPHIGLPFWFRGRK